MFWILGLQLVVLFWETVDLLEGGAQLERVGYRAAKTCLWITGPAYA